MTENYYPISLNEQGNGFSVINTGTAPTPCVLTIIPRVNQLSISIGGLSETPITITNVNANDIVVIDGEKDEITINNELAWDHFEGWSFPRLNPGTTEVSITNASMFAIEIAYNARYI